MFSRVYCLEFPTRDTDLLGNKIDSDLFAYFEPLPWLNNKPYKNKNLKLDKMMKRLTKI